MKYLFALLGLLPCLLFAQPILFVEKTPLEAISAAKSSQKFVFIDFGATWCRPCQMLEQGTFKDDSVGSFFNKHFISIHIDADKQPEWVKYYKVPTYPHLLILNQNGQELWSYTSYVDAPFLLKQAKNAIQYFEEKYNYDTKPKDAFLLQKYIETIPKHLDFKDSITHVVQRFLAQFPSHEWTKSPKWELIETYLTAVELPEYQYLLHHASEFPAQQEKLKAYIYGNLYAYKNAVLKRPNEINWENYKNYYLIALQQFKEMKFSQEYYFLQADMTLFAAQKKEEAYLVAAKELLEKHKTASIYADLAMEVIQNFRPVSPLWTNAEEWAKKAVELEAFSMYPNYVYGYVKMRKNDLNNALKFAEKAKTLALDAAEKQKAEELIAKIRQKMK